MWNLRKVGGTRYSTRLIVHCSRLWSDRYSQSRRCIPLCGPVSRAATEYECVYHLCSLSVPLFLGEKLSVGRRFQEKGEQVGFALLASPKRTLLSVSSSMGDL